MLHSLPRSATLSCPVCCSVTGDIQAVQLQNFVALTCLQSDSLALTAGALKAKFGHILMGNMASDATNIPIAQTCGLRLCHGRLTCLTVHDSERESDSLCAKYQKHPYPSLGHGLT